MQIELPISWANDPKTGKPNPWRDKRVRQAANHAIDVESIVKNLLTGNEQRSYAPFPPGYQPPLGSLSAQYNYDPKKARALLEEAGQVGFEFDLLLAVGLWTGDRVWGAAVGQMLNDVGFKCNVLYTPFSEALVQMRNHETKGPFVFNQGGAPKGGPYDPLFSWQLITAVDAPYSHTVKTDTLLPEQQKFQTLIDQAKAEFDAKKRNDMYYEAAKIHYENAFAVYLFNLSHLYVTRGNIDYTEYYDVPTGMNLMAVKKLKA
ncbi:hypothetical protein AYO38_12080 [bacterium SCGC AG-212-C10]|nr:hypothetical protein AYO38_12080 [bacterium SCGC AG-212-C10]